MKTILRLEAFGFGDKYKRCHYRSWVAEIVGFDLRYNLDRRFLKPNKDFSAANNKMTRGVFFWYILMPGKLYEVQSVLSFNKCERYFAEVDKSGNILKLSIKQAIQKIEERENNWIKSI